jgi:hypothetical protein
MNTRGLMQLVILNIGLELHIVSQEVFVVLVIMALATTLSTGPLLNLIDRIFKKNIDSNSIAAEKFRILAAFDTSEGGKSLLTLVNALIRKNRSGSQIDMLHVAQGNELTQFSLEDREREIFTPVLEKAQSMAQPVTHIFRLASNPFREIVNTGNRGDYNLLIVNFSASIFERSTLGRVLRYPNFLWLLPSRIWQRRRLFPVNSFDNMARSALLNAHIPTGIFLDRGLKELRYIFVPLLDAEDMFIGKYFHLLASNAYVRITLWDCAGLMNTSLEMINCVRKVREINPYLFQQWDSTLPIDLEHLERHDLLLTGVRSWKKIGSLYPAMQRSKISALLLQS